MSLTGTVRAGARRIETALGPVMLDLSIPGRIRATAGGTSGLGPLVVAGRSVAVELAFQHDAGSGRYSLLAEGAPVAWDPEDSDRRLPDSIWKAAAVCTLESVEAFLTIHPEIARVADLAAVRARIVEIDETLDAAEEWVGSLREERIRLSGRMAPLRRGLLSSVA